MRLCLHLKSAVTVVAHDVLVHNPQWIGAEHFPSARLLEVHPEEPYAANVLRLGDTLLCSAHAPRTRERLETLGIATRAVDVSELAKAEAGLTCCSLIVPESG
jgi:dimethylargininase